VDEQALEALVGEVEQAWNAHDMSRFAACFAEDADFVNVRGWWWRGRGEIELTHALLHETMFSDSFMELERAATKEVGAGVVVMHVKWRMVGHERGGPQETSEASNGHLVMGDSRSGGNAGDCLFPQHRHDGRPVDSSARRWPVQGRHLILRERATLEQPFDVGAANVELPESRHLHDRKRLA
jgi:uncharacterized protein (TIGR02246 family)